jgi:PKD repeat protein
MSDTLQIKDLIQVSSPGAISAPVAGFKDSPETGFEPLTVQFTDTSTENPVSWNWDFGDGSSSVLQNPIHIYQKTGKYSVKLIVSNTFSSDTIEKVGIISVIQPLKPNAGFIATLDYGNAPLTVYFTDTSTNHPTSWKWEFGDGSYSTMHYIFHVYDKPGNYSVSLIACNPAGCDTFIVNDAVIVSGSEMIRNVDKKELEIYPQPAKTLLNIKTSQSIENFKVSLYSLTGTLLISQAEHSPFFSLDVSAIQTGVYLLEINTGKEKVRRKIIVEK